ncbi:MAG: hypothetical protein JW838_10275 [Spirochaetes bacterium]|nr:hypothetical protein [Spirochaetota bacterium]
MKRITLLFIITIAAFTASAALPDPKEEAVSPEESERILGLIFERSTEIYSNYTGVESTRVETMREYDPRTEKLRSVSEVTMKRKDYFYRDPEVEVLKYTKDGVEMKPSAYRVFKSRPAYPVFDEKGRERYTIRVAAIQKLNRKKVYRIEVTPKANTPLHFKGNIYCTKKSLETVLIEGTMAKLGFPLREFRMELRFTSVEDIPVVESGTVHVRVKVPIVYPDTKIVSEFTASDTKLLKQGR